MGGVDCEFPLFRERYFVKAIGPSSVMWGNSTSSKAGSGLENAAAPAAPGMHHLARPNLKSLDLKALPRDDGPPSETQLRRQKFMFFEKQCSEVGEGLFLSGDYVAKNQEILRQHRITHVVNCVGFICKEYFKGELQYKTFYLQGGWVPGSGWGGVAGLGWFDGINRGRRGQ